MEAPKTSKLRRFRPRVSLRGLLVAVALFGVLFAWLAMKWRAAKRQEEAAAALKPLGSNWSFNYRWKNSGPDSESPKQATWVPDWLTDRVTPHFFQHVRSLVFGDPNDPDWPRTDDDEMEMLQNFPGLRGFELFATDVTDRGLAQIEHCPEMHYLTLWQNKHITHEAMKSIKKLRRLHTFESYGTLNSDAGLVHLKELPQLRELFLIDFRPESGITDEGLVHVGEMKSLHLLSIHASSVTDQGLIHLEKLPELEELYLSTTKVTPEGVKRLQSALPNAKVTIYFPPQNRHEKR
jgi:hypothetical protein